MMIKGKNYVAQGTSLRDDFVIEELLEFNVGCRRGLALTSVGKRIQCYHND